MARTSASRHNRRVGAALAGVMFAMLALSFAAVPLYRLFCQATGYGGTPRIAKQAGPGAEGGSIVVRFNADVSPALPWRFAPAQPALAVQLGEEQLAFYSATNNAPRPVTGRSAYNVTPDKAAKYVHKTACFCFIEQTLQPGQDMQFPLGFWVDPKIATDPATADVRVITLSYTFFASLDAAASGAALATAGPHVGAIPR